jgi:hypothetical protein
LQLLALRGECVFKRRAEAIAGGVALDHYAVAVLEAECQSGACGSISWVLRWVEGGAGDMLET